MQNTVFSDRGPVDVSFDLSTFNFRCDVSYETSSWWHSPCFSCRYVRSAVLPCVEATRCLFRTRGSLPQDVVEVNEVFGMQISHSALRQKTLRVDVCVTSKSGHEECLVSGRLLSGFYIPAEENMFWIIVMFMFLMSCSVILLTHLHLSSLLLLLSAPLSSSSRREHRSVWLTSAVRRRDALSGTTCWAVPTCPRWTTRTKRAEQPAALTGYRHTLIQYEPTLSFRVTSRCFKYTSETKVSSKPAAACY